MSVFECLGGHLDENQHYVEGLFYDVVHCAVESNGWIVGWVR